MKKNETVEILNTADSVRALMSDYPDVSLRKLSIVTETTYTLLLKASKQPIVGEAYDPDAVNYEKIADYFNRRKINLNDLDWDAMMSDAKAGRPAGNVIKDIGKFEVDMDVYLRKHPTTPYRIIYMTKTHVVIMLQGTTEPQAWSWNTFLLNGPQLTPRADKKTTNVEEEQA